MRLERLLVLCAATLCVGTGARAAEPSSRPGGPRPGSAAANAFGPVSRPGVRADAGAPPAYAPPGKRAIGKYLYQLSNNTGTVPSSWASLVWEPEHKVLYVVDHEDATVGVFNDVGMELYRFGQEADLGTIVSLAVLENGDLLVLVSEGHGWGIRRTNFRGDPRGRIELQGLPEAFAKDFFPDVIAYRAGKIYVANRGTLKVAVADASGKVLEAHDLYRELGFDKLKTSRGGIPAMRAFSVDADGTMLFTISDLFRVFTVAPGGKVVSFGERGGSPGKFNVVAGITRDEDHNYVLTDILRGVVIIYSADLEFVGEFAERGWNDGGLIAPLEVVASGGRLYVSQSANRGVSVFEYRILPLPPPPAPPPDAPEAQQVAPQAVSAQ